MDKFEAFCLLMSEYNKDASICAKNVKDGKTQIEIKGSGINTLFLLITLTEKVIENSPLSMEKYVDLLLDKCSKKDEKMIKTFSQMFDDLMKEGNND